MSQPWLSLVGIGDDGVDGLGNPARALIASAEVLVGGARHLAFLPDDGRARLVWATPLTQTLEQIEGRRGQRVCVLASGDPLWYGIGEVLIKRLPLSEMTIIPAPSAFSLACARLGWGIAEVDTLTLHGRPLTLLHAFIQPAARIVLLSTDRATPQHVARLLCERGYGASCMVVLEHMGGAKERIREQSAQAWQECSSIEFNDLNTIAIDCAAGPDALVLARTPGLPDDAYQHDGQLTKRELRAATLAQLAPVAGQLLWDVGAGAGSIAIEWLRAAPRARAVAIEQHPTRIALASANANALGTPQLQFVQGQAPEILADLPAPDAIFIGGGLSAPDLLKTCWRALKPSGRLVANAVTVEGEAQLFAWQAQHGGELNRIAIARAEPLGGYHGWRALLPVTQYSVTRRH